MKIRSLAGLLLLSIPTVVCAQAPEAQQLEFFEQKIRPVLAQHCYACHSEAAQANKKLKAKLFVDSREGLLEGGDSGPALVKGKSAESLLIQALKFDTLQMPPAGKLPDEVIADFVKWIDLGAADPRESTRPAAKREINLDEGRKWWAFLPLKDVALPEVKLQTWSRTPIDRFVLAKQEELGLQPSPPASKEKLLRRAYYDLIGLPPTPEQLAIFVKDDSPNAFEKILDSLLASEAYGERWGRHWLDVARFAESGGYEFDGFRPGAYHYRDWVIRAINQDLPYTEFVRMQVAGDKLLPGDYQGASAVGFLVAGPYPGQITAKTVERIRYDQLDDMIMTMGGSMLGLTLGCVRCHDHKYDPIPNQDYYGIASSLARTSHGTATYDPDPPATVQALAKHAQEQVQLVAAVRKFATEEMPPRFAKWQTEELPKFTAEPRWQIVEPLTATATETWLNIADEGLVVDAGRRKDGDTFVISARTFQKNLTALRLDALTDKAMPRKGPGFGGDGSFALGDFRVTARPLDPQSAEPPVPLKLKPVYAAFEEAAQPLKNVVDADPNTFWRSNQDGGKDNAAIFEIEGGLPGFASGISLTFELKFVSQGLGRFRFAISAEPGATTWAGEVVPQNLGEIKALLAANNNTLAEAIREPLAYWFSRFDSPTAIPVRMLAEHSRRKPRPPLQELYTTVAGGQDVFLLRRGEVDNKQGKAEPSFLQALSTTATSPETWLPKAADGTTTVDPRIGLANWMTDVERGAGGLLARVLVNRLWQHHFGEGIVGTPNDFGLQGDRPSHPELLEWLAREFVKGGWKLKPLHKLMMLSAAYQQADDVSPEKQKLDPANRLLWHRQPRRLDAEIIRDALLAVGGTLNTTMYGPSILDDTPRRSVYLRVKRSELIPFMTMFDAPEPTQSIGERSSTTVPTQALAMLNSPFVRQQAEKLSQRIRPTPEVTLATAVDNAYGIAFSRVPAPAERERMLAFIEQQKTIAGVAGPETEAKALVEFCQVLLCLNEFIYVD